MKSSFSPSLLLVNIIWILASQRGAVDAQDNGTGHPTSPAATATPGGCDCPADKQEHIVKCTDYILPEYQHKLEDAQAELAELHCLLAAYNQTVIELRHQLDDVGSGCNETRATLDKVMDGSVVITVGELEIIKKELEDMSEIVERIDKTAPDTSDVQELRNELENITKIINDLKVTSPTEVRLLRQQVDELKTKLAECERNLTKTDDDSLFQPWNDFPSQDSCRELIYISEPYTVRGGGQDIGAWFRDPVLDYHKVWYVPFHHSRRGTQVDRFDNVADFSRATNYESRYVLPSGKYAQGPGMVAYNGSLYYQQDRSKNIIRYDPVNETVAATGVLDDAVIDNGGSYTTRAYTDIDLAVDEGGLWAIYSRSGDQSNTAVSRLDPQTLSVIRTWMAPFSKQLAGNCFMICSKLHCTNGHYSHDTKVYKTYDTATGISQTLDVLIDIRFGAMKSLDYNPQDQKLYGWDDGHQVIYDLTFDPRHDQDPEPELGSGSDTLNANFTDGL